MTINKDNMIITIDSELGSNSDKVAEALAESLGLPCYGTQILDKAAELSGIPAQQLYRYDGHTVHAAYDLMAEDASGLKMRPAADFIKAQLAAAQALAAQGPCILLDRHATAALEGRDNHVSIFIHADLSARAAVIAAAQNISAAEAEHTLKKADAARRRHYKSSSKHWGEASAYSLTVNTTDAAPAAIADSIVRFLEIATKTELVHHSYDKAM